MVHLNEGVALCFVEDSSELEDELVGEGCGCGVGGGSVEGSNACAGEGGEVQNLAVASNLSVWS